MRITPLFMLVTLVTLLFALRAVGAAVDYSRDILPILSENCYHCHGPDEASRKAKLRLDTREGAFRIKDPVIIPGKSSESELIRRIVTDDEDDKMPPPSDSIRKLTPKQIELLTRWIDEGAKWDSHWAFTAPRRPELPDVARAGWARRRSASPPARTP